MGLNCDHITLFKGDVGNGISSIAWTSNSGTEAQGTAGTTDTYTITYDDATTDTYVVTNGANGSYGGYSSRWLYDGTSINATDLSIKDFIFNNGTLASVTEIYIHDTNADSDSLEAFLDSFNDPTTTIFGNIRISKETDSSIFWMGAITAITDIGDYHKLVVTHVESNGTFTDNDSCIISYTATGATGAIGGVGAQGVYGGYSSEWNWDSSNIAGAASGEIRFNNSTLASVAKLFISDTNADSVVMQAWLDAWDNDGNFGSVRISDKLDSNIFWMGKVTAEDDSGVEHDITVTHVASNGTFVDGNAVIVSFVNNGYNEYDKYTALITQAGTGSPAGDPTVAILGNNQIGTIVWTYSSVGIYFGTLSGAFTGGVLCQLNQGSWSPPLAASVQISRHDNNTVKIYCYNAAGSLVDGVLKNANLEIRVYA